MKEPMSAPIALKMLFTVSESAKADFYTDFLQSQGANLQLILHAHGTAPSEALRLLGLTETQKSLLLSVVRAPDCPRVLAALEKKFRTLRAGKGIAFTVPLSAVIGTGLYQFLCYSEESQSVGLQNEGGNFVTYPHEAIFCIVNEGFSEAVMDAARALGAHGGTVLRARGTANPETERKFSIPIQPEKEIVMILTERAEKDRILHGLYRAVGLQTPGQGIAFSLPVDAAIGLTEAPNEAVKG